MKTTTKNHVPAALAAFAQLLKNVWRVLSKNRVRNIRVANVCHSFCRVACRFFNCGRVVCGGNSIVQRKPSAAESFAR